MEYLIANFPSFLLKAVTLSTETVLSSNSFHKSTTLALKNFCPSVPFLFLNNLYLCPRVTLLGANSKNLSDCIDSFPDYSYRLRLSLLWSFFSPVLLAHTLSTVPRNINTYSLESFLWLFFVGLLSPVFSYPVSGMDSFIHSFILAISIAPLQVLYHSEALPTTARILYRSFTPKRTGKGLAQGPYVTARAGDELTTLRLKVIDSTKAPLRPTIIVVSATLQCTLFAKYMCILLWLCCSFLYL